MPGTEKKVSLEVRLVMSTEEEAKKGLEKHGTVIEDRHLVVSRQESDFDSWKTTVVCCLNISLGEWGKCHYGPKQHYSPNILFCFALIHRR